MIRRFAIRSFSRFPIRDFRHFPIRDFRRFLIRGFCRHRVRSRRPSRCRKGRRTGRRRFQIRLFPDKKANFKSYEMFFELTMEVFKSIKYLGN